MSSESHDDRTPRTDTPGDWVRPRLGKYTLLKPLAEGGMGQVYLAQRDGSDQICVLKTLRPDVVNDETSRRRFLREARLAAFLDHPNIARLLDAGDEDGTFCIALEFIAGKDIESMMHELIRKGRLLPFEASVSAMVGILDGLEAAHTATDPSGQPMNIVHRDLSPRNMMLTFDGQAKVIDFGVARASINDFKTAPGMVMGTFRYVSPEMATASQVDHRSDVYAAGVVLYELLTGQAVVGQTANPVDMLRAVVTQSPPPVHTANPAAPAALSPVIMRALEKNPGQRWQTAAEFRAAIVAAVPEMAHFPKPQLGLFLRTWFPGDAAAASAVVELSNFAEPSERTRTFVLDLEPVAPKDLDTMEVELETKTGLVFPPAPASLAPSMTTTVVLEPTVAAQTRLIDRSQSQRSVRPAPPPPRRGPWTHVLTAVVTATVTAAVVIGTRQPPEPQLVPVPAPSAEGRPVPAVGARTVPTQEPIPMPTKAPVRSLSPAPSPRPTPSATAAPSSAEPAKARGHATPELLRLLGKLERSLMQPLADDPALNPFLDEARRIVATLPKGSEAALQLRAVSAEPSVPRAQQLVRALEAP
ncbi:MAG: protein kinase [Myxococcota bacterium]